MKRINILFILIVFSIIGHALEIDRLFIPNISSYFYVDFTSLTEKGIISKYKNSSMSEDSREINLFAEKTGFYPEKHLRSITVLIGDKVFADKKDVAIVFNGKMDRKKILKYFLDEKLKNYKEEKIGKSVYYTAKDGYSFTFIDDNTIMFGGMVLLKKITDDYNKKISNEKLVTNFIKTNSNDIRGTFLFSDEQKKLLAKMYPKIPSIEGIISMDILIDPGEKLKISIALNTDKTEACEQITGVLKNLKLLGILYGAKLGLSEVVSKIEVNSENLKALLSIGLEKQDLLDLQKTYNNLKIKRQNNGSNTK